MAESNSANSSSQSAAAAAATDPAAAATTQNSTSAASPEESNNLDEPQQPDVVLANSAGGGGEEKTGPQQQQPPQSYTSQLQAQRQESAQQIGQQHAKQQQQRQWFPIFWQQSAQQFAHRMCPAIETDANKTAAACAAAAAVVAVVTSPPGRAVTRFLLGQIWTVAKWALGTALGVGLGLGLATHVYDQLDVWEERRQRQQQQQQVVPRPLTSASSTATVLRSSSNSMAHQSSSTTSPTMVIRRTASDVAASTVLEDEQNYHSLMVSAGYHTPRFVGSGGSSSNNGENAALPVATTVRGQVVRSSLPIAPAYRFDNRRSAQAMKELWPSLPPAVQQQLGRAVEYILRDFVGSWYWKMDSSLADPFAQPTTTTTTAQQQDSSSSVNDNRDNHHATASPPRRMLYSVARYRPIPFMDALYESCTIVFGNLATRVEHVNLPELVLLKWIRVLAHTFKWYRTLRKAAALKQAAHHHHHRHHHKNQSAQSGNSSSNSPRHARGVGALRGSRRVGLQRNNSNSTGNTSRKSSFHEVPASDPQQQQPEFGSSTSTKFVPISEMAMTKEFLFAGKLHRAVTFGLDVPSLLFADADGRECGKPTKPTTATTSSSSSSSSEGASKDVPEQQTAASSGDANNDPTASSSSTTTTTTQGKQQQQQHPASWTEDEVLAARLFDTDLVRDCELDYNRVVGQRMVRALVPRSDFGSNIVSTLLTEIMGGCVLTPVMGIFTPEYLNSWLISGLDKSEDKEKEKDDTGTTAAAAAAEDPFDVAASEHGAVEMELTPQELAASAAAAAAEGANQNAPAPAGASTASLAVDASSSAAPAMSAEDGITAALTTAMMDLQKHVDFEEVRVARAENTELPVDWDDPGCRSAVLRLVLAIEAALTHGRCTYKPKEKDDDNVSVDDGDVNNNNNNSVVEDDSSNVDDSEQPVEVTLPEFESANFTQILMEITSDIDAFEERIDMENSALDAKAKKRFDDMVPEKYQPSSSEQSTMRTLIAAWLHTGQVYRTLNALVQAHDTILAPYYHRSAFLRSAENASSFVRQLRALTGVDIMVDTMTVLASPRLEETNSSDLSSLVKRSSNTPSGPSGRVGAASSLMLSSAQLLSSSSTPRYLDFHRNESFAASLRSERERRVLSWERIVDEEISEGVPVLCRSKGITEEDAAIHRDLHHIARIFYAGTNMIALRDAARRKTVEAAADVSEPTASLDTAPDGESGVQVSLLIVETACPRRRIEVPDDDSSFLLRAQPRPLNAVGVHRDQRQHEQSFKCFAATYEEPAVPVGSDHYTGGRYIRRCLVRYYPIDRTASIALQNDPRRLDQRKSRSTVPDTITLDQSSRQTPFLSTEFLKERHLCQRWVPKGTTRSQSLLASSVMEPTDFTASPRTGKAIDFVYRSSFYERPMLDLGGKHFTVHDSSALGAHRADASALEMSDASLSAALLTLGSSVSADEDSPGQGVEFGKDGYPVIWMKFSRKQDDSRVEVKPYRTSFVRAALLISSARQEAQQHCLVRCVKAGSAKKATKALTDTYLRRTLRLVEYAGSSSREKESMLLRDLKLGVNHIDRSQLRRNALLSPRYPTELLDLTASVEDAVQSTDVKGVDIFGTATTVFKIRVSATVALAATDDEMRGDAGYQTEEGILAKTYKEEWIVYRSLKEFQSFHKHLKLEVSVAESSGTAGSRLVGAATAAFAATTAAQNRSRQRKMLIPSLSQASKTGALGITKNVILKRKELLAGYLGYLLSPGHLLGRCSELLLFLGAAFPLSPAVRVGETSEGTADPLGRTNMTRTVLQLRVQPKPEESFVPIQSRSKRSNSNASDDFQEDDDMLDEDDENDQFRKSERMIPAVRNKIDKVPLPQVRKQLFELLRFQFGFENASFARNRMLAALKTASFAVTSGAEFRKKLYQLHVKHINSESVAGLIEVLSGILWPNGVFFESKPPTSEDELQRQACKSRELLHGTFPDQVRAILGQELTRDGLDILWEMLQNRMVVKSMAYMLFDLLWVEVFPELGDVMPCGAALDIDS